MKEVPKISDAEWEIMRIIWNENPVTSEEIISLLSKKTNWTPQTIKTFLNRLLNKGAIKFEKVKRSYLYYPVVSEEECAKFERKSFINKVYNGVSRNFVLNFLEDEVLSKSEIEYLQKLLENKKKER